MGPQMLDDTAVAAGRLRPRKAAPRRRVLPKAAAFWVDALLFLMLFFASAAATPLYRVYQTEFHYSATTLTGIFAVYVLVLLGTLLVFGSLSDHLGRRPLIVAGLVLSAVATGVFLVADGTSALYLARSLQGLATGLATGAMGAVLVELQPAGTQLGAVITSAFSSAGLALGALVTSALVQYGPAPTALIWWILLGIFLTGTALVLFTTESGSRRAGALASLRPRIAVPRQAQNPFARAVPTIVAGWSLGGLYLSLGPSLAADLTGSRNLLWGGLVVFLLSGIGAVVTLVLRRLAARTAMLAGDLFLLAGITVVFVALATTTASAFLAGSAVAGVGFGLAYMGSFQTATGSAAPAQRAGLLAAVFTVSYFAFSLPALVAGVAATRYGLHATALVYAGSLVVLTAGAAATAFRRSAV